MGPDSANTTSLWTLCLLAAALMGSPGPSTMSVTAMGAAFGLRRSVGYAIGLVLGTTLVLLLVASGLFAILLSVPGLAPALSAASVGYIIYLAVRIACAPPLPRQSPARSRPSLKGGVLLAVSNPKAYVAIAAVDAGSRLNGLSPVTETLVKISVLTAMIVVIHAGWLLAGSLLSTALQNPVLARTVNVMLAAVMVAASLASLLT